MKPKRIQLSRRKGWRMPAGAVKVDRSTAWGNPWKVGTCSPTLGHVMARGEAVARYAAEMRNPDSLLAPIAARARRELRGKDLACWCKPGDPCHADVLLEVANA